MKFRMEHANLHVRHWLLAGPQLVAQLRFCKLLGLQNSVFNDFRPGRAFGGMASFLSLPVHSDIEFQAVAIVQYRVGNKAAPNRVLEHLEHNTPRVDIAGDDLPCRFLARAVIQIHQPVDRIWTRPPKNFRARHGGNKLLRRFNFFQEVLPENVNRSIYARTVAYKCHFIPLCFETFVYEDTTADSDDSMAASGPVNDRDRREQTLRPLYYGLQTLGPDGPGRRLMS